MRFERSVRTEARRRLVYRSDFRLDEAFIGLADWPEAHDFLKAVEKVREQELIFVRRG
jgi:hypothetical protein